MGFPTAALEADYRSEVAFSNEWEVKVIAVRVEFGVFLPLSTFLVLHQSPCRRVLRAIAGMTYMAQHLPSSGASPCAAFFQGWLGACKWVVV